MGESNGEPKKPLTLEGVPRNAPTTQRALHSREEEGAPLNPLTGSTPMIAQAHPPALHLVPALPDIAPSVGHYVTLLNRRTGEEKLVEVWSFTDSFAEVCKELDAVRDDLKLLKSEWSFEESWPIDAPF